MSANTVRFGCLVMTFFIHHVLNIVIISSHNKMLWVNAISDVTNMHNKETLIKETVKEEIRESMRKKVFVFIRDIAVPILSNSSYPKPALRCF